MKFHVRQHFLCNCKNSRISNNKRIRLYFFQVIEICLNRFNIAVMSQNIGCNIHFYVISVGKFHPFFHLFQ